MELIDTPNPNAKKILFDELTEDIPKSLKEVQGVSSVFVGPGFITITKEKNVEWEIITEDILNIFDKL
ncbi:NifU N-terminal domain-containing protein [Acidimicrobiaceae bacterium]|nr:NifU N-terminal domain-containing protein [Acidimicrobiaceae bacterium]